MASVEAMRYVALLAVLVVASLGALVNQNVLRDIDLNSQLAKHAVEVTVENTGARTPEIRRRAHMDHAAPAAFLALIPSLAPV